MSAIIYLVTNKVNGKQYIGFTSRNLDRRISDHHARVRYGSKYHFHNALRKYGFDAFDWDVIFEHDDADFTLNAMEPYYIEWFDTLENGYNSTPGGRQPTYLSGKDHHWYGKKHTKATRQKMSQSMRGIPKSDEYKRRMATPIVVTYPDGTERSFYGMGFAAKTISEETGLTFGTGDMSMLVRGKYKQYHGFKARKLTD